jgi:hypothetical protein
LGAIKPVLVGFLEFFQQIPLYVDELIDTLPAQLVEIVLDPSG